MKPATTIAALFLAVVAVLHALRLLKGSEILIGGAAVPMWASMIAAPVLALLALMLWREARR
jgi:hypothetical protein